MNMKIVLMFFTISLLSFLNCRNSAIGMINKVGINSRYYPKRYIVIQRWMKRIFRIKQSKIPRYLYIELIIAVVFATLGLANSIIAFCGNFHKEIVGILIMIHVCLIIFNMIFFLIMSFFFKR